MYMYMSANPVNNSDVFIKEPHRRCTYGYTATHKFGNGSMSINTTIDIFCNSGRLNTINLIDVQCTCT